MKSDPEQQGDELGEAWDHFRETLLEEIKPYILCLLNILERIGKRIFGEGKK
jgi:hypothetical protein